MADDTTPPHPTPAAAPAPASSIFSSGAAKPAEKTPDTAKTKLRGFEDAHFGRDATRINGEVERGIGSRFGSMSPTKAAEYAALEALVKAEDDIADSSAALEQAKRDHDVALKRLAAAQKASVDAAAEAKKIADEDAKIAASKTQATLTPVN